MRYNVGRSRRGRRRPKPKPSDFEKDKVKTLFDDYIESDWKPKHITQDHENDKYSYIIDFYTKWRGRFFYLYATYRDPRPEAVEKEFEQGLARLGYTSPDSYELAYMRHTGNWSLMFPELTAQECLEMIDGMPHFIQQ